MIRGRGRTAVWFAGALAAVASLLGSTSAAGQEAPAAASGSVVTVPVRILGPVVAAATRGDGTLGVRFSVEVTDRVRLLAPSRGRFEWTKHEAPLFPITLALPRRLPAGRFTAASVSFEAGGASATVDVPVQIPVRREIQVTLHAYEPSLPAGGEVRLRYIVANLGNDVDSVRLEPVLSSGLGIASSPPLLVLPAYSDTAGELRIQASTGAMPGQIAFVRLSVPDRGPRATAMAELAITGQTGWLADFVHVPTTAFLGSTFGEEGGAHPVLAVQGGGDVGRQTSLWFMYRSLWADGGMPVFRGYEYGPRFQLGVRHGPLEVSIGDLSVPTSALAGYYLQGSGVGAAWRSGRLDVSAMLARPRSSDGSRSGHLGLAQAYVATSVGTFGALLSDVESNGVWSAVDARRQAALLLYRWESPGRQHMVLADAGFVRVEQDDGAATTGPAGELNYSYQGKRAGLDLRVRTVPMAGETTGLPPAELRVRGRSRLFGPLGVLGGLFSETANLGPELGSRRVRGLEAGLRFQQRRLQFDVTAVVRSTDPSLSTEGSASRRTIRGTASAGLGPVRLDASAEVGESRDGPLRELAQRYQGGVNWYGAAGWFRVGLLYVEDLFIPRALQVELGGAVHLAPWLEIYGSSTVDTDRPFFGEGVSSRLGAQLDLGRLTSLFAGIESLPERTLDEPGWRFSLGVRRALSLPLPMGRGPLLEGVVFEDTNGNGVRDPEEAPLSGIGVLLGWERVVTDELGRFSFAQRTGRARVRIDSRSLGPGLLPPAGLSGPVSGWVEIPLSRAASLRVTLFLDLNGDGKRDARDTAAAGVLLRLVDESGAAWEAHADDEGVVRLSAVRPGVYRIEVHVPSLPPRAAAPGGLTVELRGGEAGEYELAIPYRPRRIRVSSGEELVLPEAPARP